jgi:Ca2+/Na+ antiporter
MKSSESKFGISNHTEPSGLCVYYCHVGIADGYVTFVVSIFGIGCLTALIGDLASHLGCTVGLKDAVTAIAIVALGTSVPGKSSSITSSSSVSNNR